MRKLVVSSLVAAGVVLLSGCGTDDANPVAAPRSSPVTSAAPTSTPPHFADANPQPPSDNTPKAGEASPGAALSLTGIRIGSGTGYDRVVFDLAGKGTPGWQVAYTDAATQDGSGRQIDVAGSSILEVRILGSVYPFDAVVAPYEGPDPVTDPSAPTVTGVYRHTVYEGTTQSFIGLNADRPAFAVSTLNNPPRLVVDIAVQ
ncbi:AMIN-like domain-containing (lipo)protein [Nocardia camponoti]|uniref:AMIN-like domain-containing protein n=1 Tax=Nocardia camponoti TaxID=1616106 RepID=A0A917QFN7_9NOCA|nr:hypothetical protein [Nocardia camponoti]GGK48306.1 hypothetical protein GCM10011591_19600 [Nocardia camponoti]